MCRRAVKMLHVASGTGTMYKGTRTVFRLVNRGCTNRPFYHICVAEVIFVLFTYAYSLTWFNYRHLFHLQKFREVKDQVIEQIGSYDPYLNERGERLVALNFDRIQYWLKQGTIPAEPVAKLFGMYCVVNFCRFHSEWYVFEFTIFGIYILIAGLAGLFPIPPHVFMRAWRNRLAKMEKSAAAKTETKT